MSEKNKYKLWRKEKVKNQKQYIQNTEINIRKLEVIHNDTSNETQ